MLPRMEEGETSDFSDVQPLMSGESSTARRFPARALAGAGILLIGIVALYPKSQGAAPSLAAVHESIGLIDYVNYTAEDCKPYMIETGCGWTELYSCEGESPGTSGNAGDDGTLGYSCCCKQQMWEQVEASTPAAPTQVSDAPTKPAGIALICVALFGLLAIVGAILFCFCAGGRKKSGMNDQNASSATTRTLIQTSRDEDRQAPISRCPRWLKQVFCCCCYPRRKTAPGPLRTYYEDEDNQYQQADDARNISTSPDYYRDRDRERDARRRGSRERQRDREARDSDRDRSRDPRRTSPSRDERARRSSGER